MQQKMEKNALMVAWCCKSPEVYGGLGGPSALLKLFLAGLSVKNYISEKAAGLSAPC